MANAPWTEGPFKLVVEFCRSGKGASRNITLKHQPSVVPSQLYGRVSPPDWAAFMTDVQRLANEHPYVVKPSAGRVGSWVGGAAIGAVLGFCCINPDGGDYGAWLPQVEGTVAKWQPTFAAGGARLSVKRAQMSYWIQVDIDPNRPPPGPPVDAGGKPFAAHPPPPPGQGTYPAAAQQSPPGYPQPPPQPYGAAPPQPYGAAPTQPYGAPPPQPYGAPPPQPYGAAPYPPPAKQ